MIRFFPPTITGLGGFGKTLGTNQVPYFFVKLWPGFTFTFQKKRNFTWLFWLRSVGHHKVTFDKFVLKSSSVIIFFSISLLMY
jgi:hypothetical protein